MRMERQATFWASRCAEREVSTPSATAFILAMMSSSASPFPRRRPTVRLRLRSPACPHGTLSALQMPQDEIGWAM